MGCSRAGAAAAAFWLTTEVFPLTTDGLGHVLRPRLRAARRMHSLLQASSDLQSLQEPELDIVGYLTRARTASRIDSDSVQIFDELALRPPDEQWHLATYNTRVDDLARRGIDVEPDQAHARILRSVLMKPEHDAVVDDLVKVLEETSRRAVDS